MWDIDIAYDTYCFVKCVFTKTKPTQDGCFPALSFNSHCLCHLIGPCFRAKITSRERFRATRCVWEGDCKAVSAYDSEVKVLFKKKTIMEKKSYQRLLFVVIVVFGRGLSHLLCVSVLCKYLFHDWIKHRGEKIKWRRCFLHLIKEFRRNLPLRFDVLFLNLSCFSHPVFYDYFC